MKLSTLALALLASPWFLATPAPRQAADQEKLEEAFAELLTGARLTGWFTDSTRPDAPPSKDSYVIATAEKSDGDKWAIEAVIGENGAHMPLLYLDVKWAGDTPVITLDGFDVPGMGKFDARVLFHGKSYAGVWKGEKHSGEMAGRIERATVEAGAKK